MKETRLILLMILAHLLGDFVWQGDKMIQMRFPKGLNQMIKEVCQEGTGQKNKKHHNKPISIRKIISYTVKGNLLHGAVHGLTLYGLIIGNNALGRMQLKFFKEIPFDFDIKLMAGVICCLVLLHFAIDQCKVIASFRFPQLSKTIGLFLSDQAAHLISFSVISAVYAGRWPTQIIQEFIMSPISFMKKEQLLFVMIIFIGITNCAGIFIAQIIGHIDYKQAVHNESLGAFSHTQEIRHGGYIIGILERILIVCSILMGNIQLIGYILTAKSIARLTKLKEDKFAEYFLIGNALSFIIAIAGGSLIKALI